MCCAVRRSVQENQELHTTSVAARSIAVARVLLLCRHEQCEFRSNESQLDVSANSVDTKSDGTGQMGDGKRIKPLIDVSLNFRSDEKYLGPDWFPMDRCDHGPVAHRRLDPSNRSPCSRQLPDSRRSLDLVGRRNEGVRRAAVGRRLVGERRHLDMVVGVIVFRGTLQRLLPGGVRTEGRSERGVHSSVFTNSEGIYPYHTHFVELA